LAATQPAGNGRWYDRNLIEASATPSPVPRRDPERRAEIDRRGEDRGPRTPAAYLRAAQHAIAV